MTRRKIILGVTGASGALYAHLLLKALEKKKAEIEELAVILSDNAKDVWKYELDKEPEIPEFAKFYDKKDFYAPFASGSSKFDTLIVCPCSMGTLGRIASGVSDDLLLRAADVILKEKRNLILVPRESPFNLIHLQNMTKVCQAGATIIPAIPSFYSRPKTIEELAETVVERIMVHSAFDIERFEWGKNK